MNKLLHVGVLAVALNIGLASASLAQGLYDYKPYAPATLDQTGFAPSAPITAPGYSPTAVSEPAAQVNNGSGTNGNGWEVNGKGGDIGGGHNNGRTNFNSDYDFRREYRFTGDDGLGQTNKTHQSAIQGMLQQTTQTGLLSPPGGASFAGPSSFGFHGSGGDMYHGIYQSRGFSGNPLPGTGTGEIDLDITDGY